MKGSTQKGKSQVGFHRSIDPFKQVVKESGFFHFCYSFALFDDEEEPFSWQMNVLIEFIELHVLKYRNVIFMKFELILESILLAHDAIVYWTDELHFGRINLAVNRDDNDLGVKACCPENTGCLAGPTGTVDDKWIWKEIVLLPISR